MTPDKQKAVRPIRELIGQAIGEASMCWTPGTGDAVFDSTHAATIVDKVVDEIQANIGMGWTRYTTIMSALRQAEAERDELRADYDRWTKYAKNWKSISEMMKELAEAKYERDRYRTALEAIVKLGTHQFENGDIAHTDYAKIAMEALKQ